ncbi:C4-dicarboxylate-specific signal transduction histidine kinase [Thermocatellispora tengchongensis]|uniref:C4-dicarboxylate-specific signal transduction histidine kinase n=1 Tax=Thermocatellispora tengchongensis TaxID=1073253 RepID=A0A840P876_9ACTN|nr:hypothetical protein [Thermocatellispora tengchongensis]MBB5137564.1 C4-dicarboxylate-specific signal transduction histidine kinase [Thermocatellispora tengchongensis]
MPASEPSLGEITRTIERFEADTKARFAELSASMALMVTRDLYEVQRVAMVEDITELREALRAEQESHVAERRAEADRRQADRRMVVSALLTAFLSIAAQIIQAALSVVGGG